MRDIFIEIWASMRSNKTRIALTGFSIGWGMFILIVLLGAGNGILRGVSETFSDKKENLITLTPDKTALPWEGKKKDQPVYLTSEDLDYIQKQWSDIITEVFPFINIHATVTYVSEYKRSQISGTKPKYMHTQTIALSHGRDLNDADMMQSRKVCVMEERMARLLFKNKAESAVGKYVTFNNTAFQVIGIYKPLKRYITSQVIYIPLTTMRSIWSREDRYDKVILGLTGLLTSAQNEAFKIEMQHKLSEFKNFSPDDTRAISIQGAFEFYIMIMGVLSALKYFVWFVGVATLMAGIVGISNIMFIAVKERTRELGVRKAMGASNFSIIRLVLFESVIISLVFGYVGMMIGIGITQLISMIVTQATAGQDYNIIGSTSVDISIVIAANVLMILAGLVAGYFPARHAVNIKLVDALSS